MPNRASARVHQSLVQIMYTNNLRQRNNIDMETLSLPTEPVTPLSGASRLGASPPRSDFSGFGSLRSLSTPRLGLSFTGGTGGRWAFHSTASTLHGARSRRPRRPSVEIFIPMFVIIIVVVVMPFAASSLCCARRLSALSTLPLADGRHDSLFRARTA